MFFFVEKYYLQLHKGPHLSPLVGLFLLSQVMSVFQYKPITSTLAAVLMNPDREFYDSLINEFKSERSETYLESYQIKYGGGSPKNVTENKTKLLNDQTRLPKNAVINPPLRTISDSYFVNIRRNQSSDKTIKFGLKKDISSDGNKKNIFQEAILQYLNAKDIDLLALPAICLLHMIIKNTCNAKKI